MNLSRPGKNNSNHRWGVVCIYAVFMLLWTRGGENGRTPQSGSEGQSRVCVCGEASPNRAGPLFISKVIIINQTGEIKFLFSPLKRFW